MDFFEEFNSNSQGTSTGSGKLPKGGNGLAVASVIIGVGSLLLLWMKLILIFLSLLFIVANVIGIFLAISARRKNESAGRSSGLPTVGLVINIISLVIYGLGFTACTACTACAISWF